MILLSVEHSAYFLQVSENNNHRFRNKIMIYFEYTTYVHIFIYTAALITNLFPTAFLLHSVHLSMVKVFRVLSALLLYAVLLVLKIPHVNAGLTNCCLPENTMNGVGCSVDGTEYEGDVYYCVEVKEVCPYCLVAPDMASAECYQCCAMGENSCEEGPLSANSYRKILK